MRKTFGMDADWQFCLEETTESAKTHAAAYTSAKAGGIQGYASTDFEDADWQTVSLPHDFGRDGAFAADNPISGGYKKRRVGWYRKRFLLSEEFRGKSLTLVFDGIAVHSEIYFNGSLTARSFSGSVPVEINLSDRAVFGDRINVLAVRADGVASEGWWYEGAGIYRHVRLTVKDTFHFAENGVFAKPICTDEKKNLWTLCGETEIANDAKKTRTASLSLTVLDARGKTVAETVQEVTCGGFSERKIPFSMPVADPERWDVAHPNLYTLRASLQKGKSKIDGETIRFGFRTAVFDPDKGFLLNGKPLKIYGACCHQDHAGVGVAVPDALQYERIKMLKSAGFNAYRCAHHLHARELLDACDELGMLVVDENRSFESTPDGLEQNRKMARRDRNHPAVILYSIFNEEPLQGTAEGNKMATRIKQAIAEVDDSRPICGALHGGYLNEEGTVTALDVTGLNYKMFEKAENFHRKFPKIPVFGSENCSAVSTRGCYKTEREAHILSCYGDEVVPWGQSVKDAWRFLSEHEWFAGIFLWTGFDYLGEPTPFEWPSVGSQFGVMDRCGFPKDAYYDCLSCFSESPVLHLLPHWNWAAGETVRVSAFTNCAEAELFCNGRSLGKKTSGKSICTEWQVPFEAGTLSCVGYLDGKPVAKDERRTAGTATALRVHLHRKFLQNDGFDALLADVSVSDAAGNPVETDTRQVTFTLEGDGRLLGVGNGDPNSHESDGASVRSLFAGKCQAVIGSVPGGKELTLHVMAEGLTPAEVRIDYRAARALEQIGSRTERELHTLTVWNRVFDEKPDATVTVTGADMNSFEPAAIDKTGLASPFTHGWRLYRLTIRTGKNGASEALVTVSKAFAKGLEVYANAQKILAVGKTDGEVRFSVPTEPDTTTDIRILLQAEPDAQNGIGGRICLQTVPPQKPAEREQQKG